MKFTTRVRHWLIQKLAGSRDTIVINACFEHDPNKNKTTVTLLGKALMKGCYFENVTVLVNGKEPVTGFTTNYFYPKRED